MNSNNLRERYFKGRAYIALAPAILFASSVWFTPNVLAAKLGHIFQVYISLLLFFSASYIWSQSKIASSIFPSNTARCLSFVLLFIILVSCILTLYLNPAYGLGFILTGLLVLFFGISANLKQEPPPWFKQLIRKSNIMLCICLIVMIAYWLNPYSQPLNYY